MTARVVPAGKALPVHTTSTAVKPAPTPRRKKQKGPLAEIRHMQNTTDLICPKAAVKRLVHEILRAQKDDARIEDLAIKALHEACEAYVVKFFELANVYALHAKRVTIEPKDLKLVNKIRQMDMKH